MKFIFIRELQQNLRSLFQSYSVLELDTHTLCSRLVQIQTDLLLTKLLNEKPFLMSQALKASLEEKLLACQHLTQLSITVEVIEQGIRNGLTYIKPGEFGLEVGTNPSLLEATVTVGNGSDSHYPSSSYHPISLLSELDLLPYDISSLTIATSKSLPEWALRALSWILRARRPMKSGELTLAISLVEFQEPIFEFAAYAILFWPEHFREAMKQGSYPRQLLGLLKSGIPLEEWGKLYCNLGGKFLRPDIRTKDHLLLHSQLGFTDVIDVCLSGQGTEYLFEAVLCASLWGGVTRVSSKRFYRVTNQKRCRHLEASSFSRSLWLNHPVEDSKILPNASLTIWNRLGF